MIIKTTKLWRFIKFSYLFVNEMYGDQSGEDARVVKMSVLPFWIL